MRTCVCDNCGMTFDVRKLDKEVDCLQDGSTVTVLYFVCPKCDDKYVVSVMDKESFQLREDWKNAQESCRNISDPNKARTARNEAEFRKRKLFKHTGLLKKMYLKELRRRGQ